MRFLFEFVSCCGSPTLRRPEPNPPADDEERSLVTPPDPRSLHRKKRGRMGRLHSAPEWRPSLESISEDDLVPQIRERTDSPNGRGAKRRSSASRAAAAAAATKVRHPKYSNDYGPAAMPMIMPTFSPTPFMF